MARPKKNNDGLRIPSEGEKLEPTKNTKEEIEAALARARGEEPKKTVMDVFDNIEKNAPKLPDTHGEDPFDLEQPKSDVKTRCISEEEINRQKDEARMSFVNDCANLDITAEKCKYWATKNEDTSILDYVKAIVRKICDESSNGGYTTSISFRVTPRDWVNIQHIIDWFKVRGFEILNFESNHPQFGPAAGSIEYNFQISWANV